MELQIQTADPPPNWQLPEENFLSNPTTWLKLLLYSAGLAEGRRDLFQLITHVIQSNFWLSMHAYTVDTLVTA